jgi:hypothetical protein
MIVHAPADIERINLDVAVVRECGGDIRVRRVQRQGPTEEPAGGKRSDVKRERHGTRIERRLGRKTRRRALAGAGVSYYLLQFPGPRAE